MAGDEADEIHSAALAREFEALLEYLKSERGFDFTAYKRTTLMRRVLKRIQSLGRDNFDEYRAYLEAHPDEVGQLFNTILINVTGFFRDPLVWEGVRSDVVPDLVEHGPAEIRVWSAGTASGEEAYSFAMVFADALGIEEFRRRVKIYATDVDEDALTQARLATYTEKDLQAVPSDLAARFFEASNGRYTFHKDLRRSVIFGRHDLLQDAPISRVSLLSCRNTVMYFNSEAQRRVLDRFEFALLPGGYILLGKAEMLLGRSANLAPVDLKRRIFRKTGTKSNLDRHPANASNGTPPPLMDDTRLRELALDADPTAQILIDAERVVVTANDRARSLFGIKPEDLGKPLQDLEVSYRPVELRSLVDRSIRERRPAVIPEVDWMTTGGHRATFEVHVIPLMTGVVEVVGVKVLFTEITQMRRLQDELRRSNQELETAYEELQSTNEELETTNEELQSTVEELETTNEELQSTNEELETMNEELQSTNEELHGVNAELRERGEDLNKANSFLESILRTLQEGVVVVDSELRVQAWNAKAHDMWGLRSDEVYGRHLLNLDIGLPVDQLLQTIRGCLNGNSPQPVTVQAVNRRGRGIHVRVTCSPLVLDSDGTKGTIMLMVETPPQHPPTEN